MTKGTITKIIVEGPDCSGKSTLVEHLKNKLRWDSKSLHHIPGNQFYRYLKEYANQEKIVFDRSHYSESVYSKLWRNDTAFSQEEKKLLDQISKHNTLIIFALPKKKVIENRYKERKFQQQISLEDLKKSYAYFIRELGPAEALIYRSENYEELDNLIEKIKKEVL